MTAPVSASGPGGDPVDWPVRLFRASVVPTAVVGVGAAVVGGVTRGLDGAAGALLGAVLVVLIFGLTLWFAKRTAALHPVVTMTAAMSSYLLSITVLLVVLVVVRKTGVVDRDAVGLSLLTCVFVWLAAQLRAFLGLKLFLDPTAGVLSAPRTGPQAAAGQGPEGPDRPRDPLP